MTTINDPLSNERIEEFLHKITKPLFVWRLARGRLRSEGNDGQRKAAQIRYSRALDEVREAIRELIA
jgi:hypothetical protein